MSNATRRVFQALNGQEIRSLIQNEIDRALAQRAEFRLHLAYPQVKWRFTLEIDIYRPEHAQVKMDGGAEYVQEDLVQPDGTVSLPPFTEVETIQIQGGENSAGEEGKAPDQIREEAGLTVHQPAPSNVGIVDKPVARRVSLDRRAPAGLASNPGAVDAAHQAHQREVQDRGPLEGQPSFHRKR